MIKKPIRKATGIRVTRAAIGKVYVGIKTGNSTLPTVAREGGTGLHVPGMERQNLFSAYQGRLNGLKLAEDAGTMYRLVHKDGYIPTSECSLTHLIVVKEFLLPEQMIELSSLSYQVTGDKANDATTAFERKWMKVQAELKKFDEAVACPSTPKKKGDGLGKRKRDEEKPEVELDTEFYKAAGKVHPSADTGGMIEQALTVEDLDYMVTELFTMDEKDSDKQKFEEGEMNAADGGSGTMDVMI